jgi:hypothetical protein
MDWSASDVISTDRYLESFPEHYYKMDALTHGRPVHFRQRVCVPPSTQETLLITGHSDYPITDALTHRYPNALWFGVNNQSSRAIGLPLGITNNTTETNVHPIYGNVDVMVEVAGMPRDIQTLVYMNFSVETYPVERRLVLDMFRGKDWVTVGTAVPTLEGRKAFLTDMRNHSYVLCPRGNGVDTHRLWEALYMGSIPIVLWDSAHAGWADLPILFVKSWDEVTEERLRAELPRFQTTQWDRKKLRVGYWINHIRTLYNETRNHPRGDRYKPAVL